MSQFKKCPILVLISSSNVPRPMHCTFTELAIWLCTTLNSIFCGTFMMLVHLIILQWFQNLGVILSRVILITPLLINCSRQCLISCLLGFHRLFYYVTYGCSGWGIIPPRKSSQHVNLWSSEYPGLAYLSSRMSHKVKCTYLRDQELEKWLRNVVGDET